MLNPEEPSVVVLDMSGCVLGTPNGHAAWPDADDIAPCDWSVLFGAVKARLRSAVGPSGQAEPSSLNPAREVRSEVLQCVAALDRLQATMARHIERQRLLEQKLSEAAAALEQARAALGSARDGQPV
jgi:hypothetical protein